MEWEYLLAKSPDWKNIGPDGWELVGIRDGECIFKRPVAFMERFTAEQTERVKKGKHESFGEIPRVLNPELAALLRRIGHTQLLLVCDRGFPVPPALPCGVLDLSVTSDVPTIPEVLGAILPELPHDRIIVAREMRENSAKRFTWHKTQPSPVEVLPHAEFKHLAREALACVRTGDATPYANVLVVGG